MKRNPRPLALPLVVAASLLLVSHRAPAQDATTKEAAAPDAAAMMAEYMKLIAPGAEHKQLESRVGDWTAKQTLWESPDAPPVVSEGTASYRMVLGGRYLMQTYRSEIPGLGKFEGRGTTAYDNATKEYVGTWIDSLSTGIMVSKGKATEKSTIAMSGEVFDALTGHMVTYRTVEKLIDADRHEMQMFEKHPGADERKLMEVVYTRVKATEPKPAKQQKEKAAEE